MDDFKNVVTETGWTTALLKVWGGHVYTVEEIIKGGNPADFGGETIAHKMAWRGHAFTVDELIQLKNPADHLGKTIAHVMASMGYAFSLKELIRLNNPATEDGNTIAHMMADKGHTFSIDELIQLGNPANNHGETIAHLLASKGLYFQAEEILKLANPLNKKGMSVTKIMAEHGYLFSIQDVEILGKLADIQADTYYGVYLSYKEDKPIFIDSRHAQKVTGNQIVLFFDAVSLCRGTQVMPYFEVLLSLQEDGLFTWVEFSVKDNSIGFNVDYSLDFQDYKPKIDDLVNKINIALKTRQNLNISPLLNCWVKQDQLFSCQIKDMPNK